ncbi:MAG: dihydroorotase family protein [Euryarchaeota archaeon]|nr:dihydroorotase family protein [Euryarchaeota archaeon]
MLVKNAKIATPGGIVRGSILIEEEKIAAVGRSISARGKEKLNLRGKLVLPGLVDIHVHMRDFREGYKEDLTSGSRAALAGGVTSFLEMPNTQPPVVSAALHRRRLELAARRSLVDFWTYFGVTGDNLEELTRISPRVCKLYLDGTLGEVDYSTLEEALRLADFLAVHAEDRAIIEGRMKSLRSGDDFALYSEARPPEAEVTAVRRVASIAAGLRRRVHLCHLSTAGALEHLNEYTTCEVTPHHLLLTERALSEHGSLAKTNPPLRSPADTAALWQALRRGAVSCIASDHAPHAPEDKEGSVLEAAAGIPGLETMLPLLLTMVYRHRLSLEQLVRACCEAPARLLGIEHKGAVLPGRDADLVVVDMHREHRVRAEEFHSRAKYSPFEGWKLRGGVEMVILRGEVAYQEDDFLIRPGYGKPLFLPP